MEPKFHNRREKSRPRTYARGAAFFSVMVMALVFSPHLVSASDHYPGAALATSTISGSNWYLTGGLPGCTDSASGQYRLGVFLNASTSFPAYAASGQLTASGHCQSNGTTFSPLTLNWETMVSAYASTTGYYNFYYCSPRSSCNSSGASGGPYDHLENAIYYFQFYFDGVTVSPAEGVSYATRIDTVAPADLSLVASSTPVSFSAGGYVNSQNLDTSIITGLPLGYRIHWRATSVSQLLQGGTGQVDAQGNSISCGSDAICALGGNGSNGQYDFYSSGTFSGVGDASFYEATSSTAVMPVGTYQLVTTIEKELNGVNSLFNFQASAGTVISKKVSQFTVSSSTDLDVIVGVSGGGLVTALTGISATTTDAFLASCNIFTFSIGDCLKLIFIPTDVDMRRIMDTFYLGVLQAQPWGYVTRIVIDLQDTATTTTLTGINVSTPSQVLGHAFPISASMNLDVFGNLPTASTSFFSTATSSDNKTFREVTEPYWNILWGVIFVFMVLRLLTGLNTEPPWSDYTEVESDTTSVQVGPGHRRSDTITRRRRL